MKKERYLVIHHVDNGSLFCIANVGIYEGETNQEAEEKASKDWLTEATLQSIEVDHLPSDWSYFGKQFQEQ